MVGCRTEGGLFALGKRLGVARTMVQGGKYEKAGQFMRTLLEQSNCKAVSQAGEIGTFVCSLCCQSSRSKSIVTGLFTHQLHKVDSGQLAASLFGKRCFTNSQRGPTHRPKLNTKI